MDRAKELRQLMKSTGKKDEPASGGGSLSGKDKLKMMRDLKQQKVEASAPPPARPSMSKPATAPMKAIDPKDTKFMDEWKKSSSILPAGFFDGGVVHKPALTVKPAAPVVPQPKPIVPSTSSVPSSNQTAARSESYSVKPKPSVTTAPPAANLPMEFFDNAREELVARGVNLQQHILQQKKEADKELESFLEEINEIKETVEEDVITDIQDEAAMKEYEEQAIQMAYMAKLAVLYNKSDAVVGATAPRVVTTVDDEQIENSMKEMDTVIANNSSSSGAAVDEGGDEAGQANAASGTVKVRQDVEDILYRKLQLEKLKKRKLQLYSQSVRESLQQHSPAGGSSNKRQAIDISNSSSSSSNSKSKVVDKKVESHSEASESDGEDDDDDEEEDELDYSNLNYSLWKN